MDHMLNSQVLVCQDTRFRFVDAVCFDVDGTLWDSQPAHYRAVAHACKQTGCEVPSWEVYVDRSIRQGGKISDVLLQEYGMPADEVERWRQLKDTAFVKHFAPELIMRDNAEKLPDALRKARVKIALVTSGRTATIECFLQHAWRGTMPDVVVGHDDVLKTKPDPLIYQAAADRIGIDPAGLLAIEDSPAGIESAQGAGIQCVGLVTDVFTADDLKHADAVVRSFAEIKLGDQA